MGSPHFLHVLLFLFCSCSAFLTYSLQGVEGYACHAGEREALLSLCQAALSAGANNGEWRKHWDEQIDCCEWPGVRCDEVTGRVISLNLTTACSNCEFSDPCGALPSALAGLESLQVLDLRAGCFSAAIPALTLASLTNLTHLDLSYNWFSKLDLGAPDLQLVQLLKLTYLNLSYNYIDSQLNLSQLASFFPNLTHLDLRVNVFSKLDVDTPSDLLKLTYLDLSYNANFESLNLSQLVSSFPNLTHLDLSSNYAWGGVIPEHLSSLQNLIYLDLSENRFQNPLPWRSLSRLSHLQHLGLGSDTSEVLLWEESEAEWPCTWQSLESLNCINMGFRTSNVSAPLVCLEDPTLVSKLQSLSFTSSSSDIAPLLHSLSLPNNSLGLKSLSLQSTSSLGAFQLRPRPSWSKLLQTPFLETLTLADSGLISIPLWLDHQLPLLRQLDMSSNHFNGTLQDFQGLLENATQLTSLQLSQNNISGVIPESVLKPSLVSLDLSGNQLLGAIPHSIGSLSSLSELDLSENLLSGVIPPSIGSLSSLYKLVLSENLLSGVIPSSIGSLSSLQNLLMRDNRLSGEIPVSIGSLSSLVELDLAFNHLSGKILVSIGNLSSLSYLYLSTNRLSGEIPVSIGSLSSLSYLDLSTNRLSGEIPVSIGNLSSLSALHLSTNRLSGEIPVSLGNLSSLWELHLSTNRLSGEIPILASAGKWSFVNLSYNEFSGSISQAFQSSLSIQYCPEYLTYLDLSGNSFSGALPWWISNCSSLEVLNLASNSLSSMLPASPGLQLEALEALVLHNNKFTGEISRSLQNCTSLNVLDLGYNQLIGQIPEWITGKTFGMLQVLMLNNNQLEGSIPLPLVQNLSSLQILVLANNFLSGPIPSTVDHLQGMATCTTKHSITNSSYVYKIEIQVPDKGMDRMMGNYILSTFTLIDLSNNSLEGNIPPQIGALHGLHSLDLSHNKLNGSIPNTLGNLSQALECLNLSNNKLTGGIPHELCTLHFLSTFNISSNCLQGEIPQSSCTQLSSFDASSFANNDGLCGPPLPNQCPAPVTQINTHTMPNQPRKHSSSVFVKMQKHIALGGVGIGYPMGLLMVGLLLYFKYRHQ